MSKASSAPEAVVERSEAGLSAGFMGRVVVHKAGPKHPAYKHGLRSRELIEMRKEINDFARFARKL